MPLTVTMKMGSSQRGMTVFLPEVRAHSLKDGISYGGNVDHESQKIRRTALSTTVAELCYSWNVSFHASSSVDCGWTCQVMLQKLTWGLTRRTWRQQQEQVTYLSKMNQFTWFPCCELKFVQEVLMTLLTFQLRIVWQIVWRSHRRRQTIWSQQWKQWGYWKLTFIQTWGHSWRIRHSCPHGVEHSFSQDRNLFSS